MRRQLLPALARCSSRSRSLLGLVYPLVVTGIAQVAFHDKANGSLVEARRQGRRLVADRPDLRRRPQYFHPRPSAAGRRVRRRRRAAASNLGPSNPDARSTTSRAADRAPYREANGLAAGAPVPVDAVTRPGSGLDPHISLANARLQAAAGRRRARPRRSPRSLDARRRAHRRPHARLPRRARRQRARAEPRPRRARDRSVFGHGTRARSRIYLGAAPGRRARPSRCSTRAAAGAERGTDVVVGFVETHGRPKTAAQLGDLEVVPRRHDRATAGTTFEEMDVDAVLARRPEVALVDELAHTNVPGSRQREALAGRRGAARRRHRRDLDRQHPAPRVGQRRRRADHRHQAARDDPRRGRARAPTRSSSSTWRPRRSAAGWRTATSIPPSGSTPRSATTSAPGNLGALRELALLWVADRVDEALAATTGSAHGIDRPWETRERVVVALTGLRRRRTPRPAGGAHGGARRRASCSACTCGRTTGSPRRRPERSTRSASSSRSSAATLPRGRRRRRRRGARRDFARSAATPPRSCSARRGARGSAELTRGSVINRVIRDSGVGLDVHVISRRRRRRATPRSSRTRRAAARCRAGACCSGSLLGGRRPARC